jgi:hypothetical protein
MLMASTTTPLDLETREIRLLSIQPGVWSDDILCTLTAVPLDEQPRYDALSYAWGDSKVTRLISINDNPFEVTTTVWSAFRRLRQKVQTRVIWIDQICIDQSNNSEKTHQVNMMAEIYRSAQHVWIWLGDEEEMKERGFHGTPLTVEESQTNFKIDKIKRDARWGRWARRLRIKPTTSKSHDWEAISCALDFIQSVVDGKHLYETSYFGLDSEERPLYNSLVRGFELISERTWWERVWVVQETSLASSATVILGSRAILWSHFERWGYSFSRHASGCCNQQYKSLSENPRALITIHHSIQCIAESRVILRRDDGRQGSSDQLLHQLWSTRSRKSEDPRDKVFSLLGLVNATSINPDYSLTTLQVYTEVVKLQLKSAHALTFLYNFEPGRPDFPSWVPDWSKCTSLAGLRDSYNLFNTWSMETSAFTIDNDQVLAVDGIAVDAVSWLGGHDNTNWWSIIDAMLEVQGLFFGVGDHDTDYVSGGQKIDAFCRTLISDIIYESENMIFRRAGPGDWAAIRKWWDRFKSEKKFSKNDHKLSRSVNIATLDRSFFLTEQGYIGLGPKYTSIGDQVFALEGSNVPIVLRLAGERDVTGTEGKIVRTRSFTVVGDCYCHGIIDGEAVERFSDRIELISLV